MKKVIVRNVKFDIRGKCQINFEQKIAVIDFLGKKMPSELRRLPFSQINRDLVKNLHYENEENNKFTPFILKFGDLGSIENMSYMSDEVDVLVHSHQGSRKKVKEVKMEVQKILIKKEKTQKMLKKASNPILETQ